MKKYIHKNTLYFTAFFMILFIFFLLRVYKIDQLDLWRDEAFTVILSKRRIAEIVKISSNDFNSPFYPIFLHFWINIFGDSEFALRLPSAIFSTINCIYLYLIAKRYFRKLDLLIVILLYAVSMSSIFYARESRPYALLSLLLSISLFYFLKLQKSFSFKSVIIFILSSSLSIYTHNTAVIFVISEFIILFILIKQKQLKQSTIKKISRYWVIVLLAIIALVLPWLFILVKQAVRFHNDFWLTFHPIHSLRDSLNDLIYGIRLYSHRDYLLFEYPLILSQYIFIFFGSIKILKRKNLKTKETLYFVLVPYIIVYMTSFIFPLLYIRYISFLIPFMIMLVLDCINEIVKAPLLKYFIVSILLLCNLYLYKWDYVAADNSKPNYSALIRDLDSRKQKSDFILHYDAVTFFPFTYYSQDTNLSSKIYDPNKQTKQYIGKALLNDDDFIRDFTNLSEVDRLWIVNLDRESIIQKLPNNFHFFEKKHYNGNLTLELWLKDENTSNSNSYIQ